MKITKQWISKNWLLIFIVIAGLLIAAKYFGLLTITKYKEGVAYECDWLTGGHEVTVGCYNNYLTDYIFDTTKGDYVFWRWTCYSAKDCVVGTNTVTNIKVIYTGEGWTPLHTNRLTLGGPSCTLGVDCVQASCNLKYTPYECVLKEACVPKTCSYFYTSGICGSHIYENGCGGYITCTWYCPSGYQCVNSGCQLAPDPCAGINCNPYCEGNTRYYDGACANANCNYKSEYCEYGCENGYCKDQVIPVCTEDLIQTCPDGSTILIAQCIDGNLYYITGAICPEPGEILTCEGNNIIACKPGVIACYIKSECEYKCEDGKCVLKEPTPWLKIILYVTILIAIIVALFMLLKKKKKS